MFRNKMRDAAAAVASGLCETVLITNGESGCSGVGRTRNAVAPDQTRRGVRAALCANGAADFVHDPGIAPHEDLWALARAISNGLSRVELGAVTGAISRASRPNGPWHRSKGAPSADAAWRESLAQAAAFNARA
jgi:hypothetical protein